MFAMLLGQAESKSVKPVEEFVNIPKNISLTGYPATANSHASAAMMAGTGVNHAGMGLHWDTCARYALLQSPEPFI